MEHTLSFEELDLMLGNHAPFLMSLSDGLQEELHIIISAAEVGDLGDNIPNFEDIDETAKQALQGINQSCSHTWKKSQMPNSWRMVPFILTSGRITVSTHKTM